jgi:hypothetical protein
MGAEVSHDRSTVHSTIVFDHYTFARGLLHLGVTGGIRAMTGSRNRKRAARGERDRSLLSRRARHVAVDGMTITYVER